MSHGFAVTDHGYGDQMSSTPQPDNAEQPEQPEPEVHPSSTPDGPQTIPSPPTPDPDSVPDGEIHPRTQAERADEELQRENAETSLDQPS